jgi:hypothetical protein
MSGKQGARDNTLDELAMDIADVSDQFCEVLDTTCLLGE